MSGTDYGKENNNPVYESGIFSSHSSIVSLNKQMVINDSKVSSLIAQDVNHSLNFEKYLYHCMTKRLARSGQKFSSRSSSRPGTSINGDSVRYNLYPDSSDMSDSFDPETDRLSEINLRNVNLDHGSDGAVDESFENNEDFSLTGQLFMDSKLYDQNGKLYMPDDDYIYQTDGSNVPKFDDFAACENGFETHDGLPINSNDTFVNYQNHSPVEEINVLPENEPSRSPSFALRYQPAKKFKDSLNIKFIEQSRIDFNSNIEHSNGFSFKGNLLVCSEKYNVAFMAMSSSIFICDLSCKKSIDFNTWWPVGWFSVKPAITPLRHLDGAVMPDTPHTINYMTIGILAGEETLGIVGDDGRAIFYGVEHLMNEISGDICTHCKSNEADIIEGIGFIQRKTLVTLENGYGEISECSIYSKFEVEVQESAWGLDMFGSFFVVSDNSHLVTIFHYNVSNGVVIQFRSPLLVHNIPSVSFLKDSTSFSENSIYVSAVTYTGYQYVVKFVYRYLLNNLIFEDSMIESWVRLKENGWTTQYVDEDCFKEVTSISELIGDLIYDKDYPSKVLAKSKALDVESDECYSSHLGLASEFEHTEVCTIPLRSFGIDLFKPGQIVIEESSSFNRIKRLFDEYYVKHQRGLEKQFTSIHGKKYWEPLTETSKFRNKFLICSTKSKIGLLRANGLICNATVNEVFHFKSPMPSIEYLNRLYLSLVIPELNCYIVATQSGYVSIFRLTKYRGLHSMRQEYVFPDQKQFFVGYTGGPRTIIGLNAKQLCRGQWTLYILYNDFLCLSYKLYDLGLMKLDEEFAFV